MNHFNQVMRVMYGKSILGIHFVILVVPTLYPGADPGPPVEGVLRK